VIITHNCYLLAHDIIKMTVNDVQQFCANKEKGPYKGQFGGI